MRTSKELDPTIRTWYEAFSFFDIPISAYNELYQRAFDLRQMRMRQSQNVPNMDATLLVSQWTGDHGLKAELRERQIKEGRTLTGNAKSQCPECFGTARKMVKDDTGAVIGVGGPCDCAGVQ